jgi:hypothetical protein
LVVTATGLWPAAAAYAHDATSEVYATVTAGGAGGAIDVLIETEYDLLMKSAWLEPDVYEEKDAARAAVHLADHRAAAAGYVANRFAVAVDDVACPAGAGETSITRRSGRLFGAIRLVYTCPADASAHTLTSAMFPDIEGYVHSTKTFVAYDLDGEASNTILDAGRPALTTGQRGLGAQMWEFAVHGAEHLLLGIDHVLFLLALLIGARNARQVVLTATAFTVAHSVTFLLAATGVVNVSPAVVEPIIAASIVIVAVPSLLAAWPRRRVRMARSVAATRSRIGRPDYLDRIAPDDADPAPILALASPGGRPGRGPQGASAPVARGTLGGAVIDPSLGGAVGRGGAVGGGIGRGTGGEGRGVRWRTVADRLGRGSVRWRYGVVFAFGLVHGLGFAGALGIDEAWSWGLLASLLSFNIGIEAVQLGIIALVFPLLALGRRRWPGLVRAVTGVAAAEITAVALVWFFERIAGA